MKHLLTLATALVVSSMAHAQVLKGMGTFLDGVKANPARAQSSEFSFPAYIKDIQVVNRKDGSKVGGVELGNDNLNGVIITWGSGELVCVLPVSDAAKLSKKQQVNVKGRVADIQTSQRTNALGTITFYTVVAQCNIQPASGGTVATAKASTPAPSDSDTSEGQYTNGKVTISVDTGPRGGTEITSSLCKGKVFQPKYDGATGGLSDPKGSYAINFGGNHAHMEVESSEKCLPEGRYRKAG